MANKTEAGIGHNSDSTPEEFNVAADELRAFVERIERLEEEKKTIAEDVRDVYGEAKSRGYDAKVLRKIVSLRKQDANERSEFEALLDLYMHALGMTPGDAARASGMMD